MDWSTIRLIWLRELRDQLRDRRTLFMIVVLPLVLYPLLGFSVMGILQGLAQQRSVVGIINQEALPQAGNDQDVPPLLLKNEDSNNLAFAQAYLESTDDPDGLPIVDRGAVDQADLDQMLVRIEEDPGYGGRWLDEKQVDVLIVVAADFRKKLERGERPAVQVISGGRESARQLHRRVRTVVDRWRNDIKERRLAQSGLSRAYTDPIQLVEPDKLQRPAAKTNPALVDLLGRLAPFLLVMWSLTGALYPAVDLCAGEKERGTMETLLISPAGRGEIVYGKFLAIWVFSAATALLNLLSIGLTAWRFSSTLPVDLFRPMALAWCLLLLMPLSAFFSALCLAIGAYARSTKEGQYYLMPLFLVTLPLVLASFIPTIKLDTLTSMIPVTGVALLLQSLIAPDEVARATWLYFIMVVVPMLVYAWLALRWAIHQFQREEVLFREAERLDVVLWLRNLWRHKPLVPTLGQAIFCFVAILVVRWLISGWNNTASLVISDAVYVCAVLVPPVLLAALFTCRPLESLSLRATSWQFLFMALGLAVLLVYPLGELVTLILAQFPAIPAQLGEHSALAQELARMRAHEGASTGLSHFWLMLNYTLSLGVLVPVCEGVAFRGLILAGLWRRFRPWTAVLLSSFLYALYHANVFQFLPAFVLGVVLALFTIRSRSVLPGIVFHCVHNSVIIIIVLAGGVTPRDADVSIVVRLIAAGLALMMALGLLARLWIRGYGFVEEMPQGGSGGNEIERLPSAPGPDRTPTTALHSSSAKAP
jgi:sodium transport system permease protein